MRKFLQKFRNMIKTWRQIQNQRSEIILVAHVWTKLVAKCCCYYHVDKVGNINRRTATQLGFSAIWPHFRLISRTIFGLAVWLVFGCFHGRLTENFSAVRFWKNVIYFKAKLSTTTPFFKVTSPVCATVPFTLCSKSEAMWVCDCTCRLALTLQANPLGVSLFMIVMACNRPQGWYGL